MTVSRGVLGIAIAVAIAAAAACGGGGGGSTTGPSGGGSGAGATITINATGVSTGLVRIEVGQQVRFQNSASRNVEIASDPHLVHDLCPPLNIGVLASGQNRSVALTQRGTCTYHDHLNPDDARFRGTILIGVSEPGPAPDYRTTQ